MYRQRIEQTRTRSPAARRLQRAMLEFHDFRLHTKQPHPMLGALATWQSRRLIFTHHDFYADRRYQEGLHFLFNDLYSHQDFGDRDRDLERIFPKLVKLLPSSVLETVSILVELNLLTQQLDLQLVERLDTMSADTFIQGQDYCEAFRACNNQQARLRQLTLVHEAGLKLEHYARSQSIAFGLRMTEGAAEMAGLAALHQFIRRGFKAFQSMEDVPLLMNTIVDRERALMQAIFDGSLPDTFLSFKTRNHS